MQELSIMNMNIEQRWYRKNRCNLSYYNNKEKEWLDRKKMYDASLLDRRDQGLSKEISEVVKRFPNKNEEK